MSSDAPGSPPRIDESTPTAPPFSASAGGRSALRSSRALAWLWCIVALQVAIPASYYLRSNRDDERFAWRMFSAVRVKKCRVELRELPPDHKDGDVVDLDRALHSGWISMLERGRLRVIERVLATRCEGGAERIELRRECRDAAGRNLLPERFNMACSTRVMQREVGP